jgi:myxalamid-type polyketide synthase MxaB
MSEALHIEPELSPVKRALHEIRGLRARVQELESAQREAIAIIGTGLRFPGGVVDEDSFWELLSSGKDAITEIPRGRWDWRSYFDANSDAAGAMCTQHGGFLKEVDRFDASFFGISPREAAAMDPQHRLVLEVAWQALENAGYSAAALRGSSTGVFLGIGNSDYGRHAFTVLEQIDAYTGSGNSPAMVAGRLSYVLGLHGPSLAIDTSCSSSLVAVHVACSSLRAGECSVALAGGVNLILSPEGNVALSKAHMMAPDGHCKTFDDAADGYVRAEGCSVIVLKKLSAAVADRDRILAVIRGSAVNHDGRSGGLTAPSGPAQAAVIEKALAMAGVSPAEIDYVETHGTGTALGDPIEVETLASVMGKGRPANRPVLLGAVKTNFGHAEAASGIAGLMKAVLALQHQTVPANLHLRQKSSHINWERMPVVVPTANVAWPSVARPRYAAVSSFGFSGTNAHLVLEEAPRPQPAAHRFARPSHVLALSAQTEASLDRLRTAYAAVLRKNPEHVADICFTANAGRAHFDLRCAVVGETAEQLAAALEESGSASSTSRRFTGAANGDAERSIGYLFTGQGSQYAGMGGELWEGSPAFRAAVERCAAFWKQETGESLEAMLYGGGSDLQQARQAQPALFALEYGLSELWRSWGIEPSVVLGHSLGQYVAAVVAGIFSLEDGLRLVHARAELMDSLATRGVKPGAMHAVSASVERVEQALQGLEQEVGIAAINGPSSVVISGATEAVAEASQRLEREGVRTRALEVTHAFHSPLLEPILAEFERRAEQITYREPRLRVVSNVTGQVAAAGEMSQPGYWRRHMRSTVLFHAGLQAALQTGCSTLLEIGPQPHLSTLGKLAEARPDLLWLPSLRKGRNAWLDLLGTARALYEDGFDIQWAAVHGRAGRRIALPTYPFERHRYPVPKTTSSVRSSSRTDTPGEHPLLGTRLPSPLEEIQFQSRIGPDRPTYLAHHAVQGKPVVPAAAYLEIALSAARAVGMNESTIHSAAILQPCVFDTPRTLQCVLKNSGLGRTFAIYSSAEESQDGWALHATGQIVSHAGESASDIPAADLAAIRARCSHKLEVAAFYRAFDERGLTFGPAFRPLTQIAQGLDEALVEFEIPSVAQKGGDQYQIHPVALDACLQAVAAAAMAANGQNGGLYLPSGLEKLQLLDDCRGMALAHAVLRGGRGEQLRADFHGFNREGVLVLCAEGLVVRPLPQQQPDALRNSFYEIEWLPLPNDSQHINLSGTCLVLGSETSCTRFAALLKEQGTACTTAQQSDLFVTGQTADTDTCVKFLERAHRLHASPLSDVVYIAPAPQKNLLKLSGDEAAELESMLLEECLKLSQALVSCGEDRAPRFWIVTQGGQGPKLTNVAHAALWGFARSIALEHPQMRTIRIDLDSASDFDAQQLLQTMNAAGDEDELVVRGGRISVPRLRRKKPPVPSDKSPAEANLQLTLVQPGTIDGLQLLPALRREPGESEVEIEVRAAGLNFRDVLCALGIYKGKTGPLGGECAGVVVKVGPGVSGLQAGDEVIALASGCFGRFATTKEKLVWHKPPHLSFDASVTIPVAFLTARYALENIAQIRPGESVLIHAGAGGVGLAAIQIAQRAGAAIYATAGSEEKRAYLRSLGVDGVFDSRSLEFAHELRTATGKGVDVVLNSLTGAFIDAGIELLAPGGRFVELGVADLRSSASAKAIRPDVSYHAVQLAGEIEAASDLVHDIIAGLVEQFASGALQPLPRELFPLEQVHDAFRYMAQARHIGRVIVCPERETRSAEIRSDGAYLVTGGTSGLGLKVAEWLSARGAGEVIAMGRSLPSAEAAALFEAMRMQGTVVTVCQGDVSQSADVQRALRSQLPMRGIFHCAGIVDDGVLLQQNRERFQRVLAPKIGGACHLHRLTHNSPLDHFVLFSSIAGPLGSPGQTNYASANAFLDAVAHYRRSRHLPALSIDWGAWSETGMAVRHKVVERSAEAGILGISTREGLSALETLLSGGEPQTIVAQVNWPQYLANDIPPGQRKFLSGLQGSQQSQAVGEKSHAKQESWLPRLESIAKSRWKALLAQLIEEKIRLTLRLDLAQPIMPGQPLQELGLDSLLSIELRNALGIAVNRTLPATLLFNYPTLDALTDFLFRELGGDAVHGAAGRKAKPVRRSVVEDIESLSDDEVNRMLGEKAMGGVL